jgi:Spy/CpxP family protein refolding chaperone
MTKWTKVGVAVGAAIVVGGLAVAAVTWAQEAGRIRTGGPGGEFRAGGFAAGRDLGHGTRMGARLLAMLDNDRVKTALGLSEDQTNHLRQIVVDTEKSNIKTRAEMQVRGIELRELLRADNPDHQAVMKTVDELSALRAELMKQDVDALLSAKSVLTPEQQKKIRTFLERRRAGRGLSGRNFRWRGEMPGRGPRPMGAPQAAPAPKPPDTAPQQP